MSSEALGRARSRLTFWAEADPHVSGAALTGSLADGHADPWSDLDLVLGLRTFPEQVALECFLGNFRFRGVNRQRDGDFSLQCLQHRDHPAKFFFR